MQRRLKMLDGVVVQTIAREQNADSRLRSIVVRTQLIELRGRFLRMGEIAEL